MSKSVVKATLNTKVKSVQLIAVFEVVRSGNSRTRGSLLKTSGELSFNSFI